MSVSPIVSPANNAEGIALTPVITVLYPFALEEGSINQSNCFLIKKESDYSTSVTTPIPVNIHLKRIEVSGSSEFTGADYGDDPNSGELYRSLIEMTPRLPLEPHSEYSVILSRDIAKRSIFDLLADGGNSGSLSPVVKGPYEYYASKDFELEIVASGNESNARYTIKELPLGSPSDELVASKRFIEFEDGIYIDFPVGEYYSGDSFSFKCIPLVKSNELYSFNFKTGSSDHVTPRDENSDVIVGLPVEDPEAPVANTGSDFKLLSVEPELNSVMNSVGTKTVTFTFSKNIDETSVTAESIKAIAESTTGPQYGALEFSHQITDNKLIITFSEEP